MIREAYRRKKAVPERIQNAPDLFLGLELFFDAFMELSTCRNTGWSPGPIPSWCISEFCVRMELDEETTDDMIYHIRQMDQAFMKYADRKNS